MSIIGSNILAGAAGASGAATGYRIERSLRFNQSDTASLSKTFSSAGNRKTWTWSSWVKLGKLSSGYHNLFANLAGNTNGLYVYFNDPTDSKLYIVDYNLSGGASLATSRVFRDHSAWYHIVIAFDTTQATPANRVKVYVNGVQETLTGQQPNQNSEGQWNQGSRTHYIGRQTNSTTAYTFNGYLADVHFVDGQALAPTDFGEFDDNNVWQPKEFAGQYAIAEALGSSSPTVFVGVPISALNESDVRYLNSNPDGSSYPIIHESSTGTESERTIRVKFHTPVSSVTSIKFRGGGYAAGQAYTLYVNGSQVGGTHTTASGWSEVEHTISSTDVSEIKIIGGGSSYGFALGQLKFNNSLVSGTPSYGTLAQGTNSFHLNFSDNSSNAALGTDSSGNSNTWTVNNLTASYGNGRYIGNVTGTPYSASYPAISAFDGNVASTYSQSVNGGNMTFTPSSPISVSSSLKVIAYTTGSSSTFTVNGTDYRSLFTTTGTQTITIPETSITSIVWGRSSNGSSSVQLQAIEVDGSYLIDYAASSNKDIDSLVDTPTNYGNDTGAGGEVRGNYATWNPLTKTGGTLTNGNLEFTGSGWRVVAATIMLPKSGKYYLEATVGGTPYSASIGALYHAIGLIAADTLSSWSYSANNSCFVSDVGWLQNYSTDTDVGPFANGTVIGLAINIDSNEITVYVNGSSATTATIGIAAGTDLYVFNASYSTGYGALKANFGQRAFAYAAPSGYKALCTQNLPEPTIADGSAYFDTVLYTGNAGSLSISDYAFSPDFVWIKQRSLTYYHRLLDTVRGIGSLLYANYSGAADSQPNSNDNFASFDSDGFTLGAGIGLNTNGAPMVAWAWDAGANSSKTYTVTVVSDSGNKYRFDGHGTSAVTLDLEEGSTYTFDQSDSSNAGHPLRFSTTSNGTHGGGSEYTTGVVTSGTPGAAGAYTKITIAASAPVLYYYCTQHSGMGGQINTNSTAGATVLSGSLTSVVYNQSQTWSGQVSGTAYSSSYAKTLAFDNNLTSSTISIPASGTTHTFTPSPAFSSASTVTIYYYYPSSSANSFALNGNDVTSSITTTSGILSHTFNVAGTGFTSLTWSRDAGISGIEVDGNLLVDPSVSVSAVVPSSNSVVRANPTAGFSITKYIGNDTTGAVTQTVPHGLNAVPEMYIVRSLGSGSWYVYHKELGNTKYLSLNSTAGEATSVLWNDTSPNSSVFSVRGGAANTNNQTFIAYSFSSVPGYSLAGSYTGNGSPDGPFVFTGMRPKWVLIKASSSTSYGNWVIHDAERSSVNVSNKNLYANLGNAEDTTYAIDFLSNGFKIRSSSYDAHNGSGKTYIYYAVAENPFRTARAR